MSAATHSLLLTAVAPVFRRLCPNFPVLANPELKSVVGIEPETYVEYLGRLHPLAVRFPSAFAFGALLTELRALSARRASLARGSRSMLHPRR